MNLRLAMCEKCNSKSKINMISNDKFSIVEFVFQINRYCVYVSILYLAHLQLQGTCTFVVRNFIAMKIV